MESELPRRVEERELRSFVQAVFQAAGLSGDDAATVTDSLVASDLRGTHSHGVIRTPFLVEGVVQALVAAIGTLVVLKLAIAALSTRFLNVEVHFLAPREIAGFLAFAAVLGMIGALVAMGGEFASPTI